MIIPLLLLYSFSISAYGIDPSAVYLYSRKSFVNYTAEHWKLHEAPANEITVALDYQLKSNGQIFAIRLIEPNNGQQSFKLSISVFDTRYIVALMDVNNNSIEQGFVDLGIQLEGNHTLYTKIANGAVSLVLDEKQNDNSVLDNALIHLRKDDTISFVIGGGGESATGCVHFKHLAIDGALTLPKDLHEVELNYVDTCNAVQDCKNRHCGAGKCVQLEVAECDCFGTRKTGPNCKDEPRDIRLKNDDDTANPELIRFNTWDQQAIERIILYFEYADPTDKEGVLLHSILANGTQFKLYVVNNKGQLTAGAAHLNFTLDSETKVHKVEIEIGTKISLTVDGTVKTCATPLGMLLSSLTIGGVQSDLPDGTREIGITACFPLIYVDHYDVIDLYFKGDSKVISQSKLSSCSDEPLVSDGIKMFDTDKFQVVQMSDDLNSDSMEGLNLYEAFTKTLSTSNNCERADQHVCRHDSICEKHNTTIRCSCKSGYGGRYCQFVLMPRTCSEAQLWKLPEGPTRLDLDGPGKLSANIAVCKNGTTIVPHDMPPSTSIRDSAFLTNSLFLVSYRDFTPHQLSSLVRQSYDCSQTVAYSCNKAPLSFSSYHTWFHTAYANKTLRQMGQVPNSCACMDTGCVGHGKCNCDSGSITQDTGILTGKTAGITRVIALRDEGQVSGQMTLGELQCWGNDGTAIKFNTLNALPLEDWNGQTLSFHFATVNSTALLAEIYESGKPLYIKIVEGHTIELSYSDETLVAHSQARLNDSQWHSLVLEVIESEIRLSVDGIHVFKAIESDILPNGKLKISCINDGFIGAIRDVRINGEFVNLYQHISGIVGVDRYNGGRCSETRCQNGAICVEDFVNDSFFCRCKYPNIHSGKNCEINLNRESSISLHGGNIRLDESSSPLEKQTVLSFRTDQHNALIFFAHDENNNFVQLHLSNEVNITLTLNNEDVVSSCTVSALMGKEFANMEWIQISIEHKPEYSTLIVEEDACVIRESRQLATKPIKKYSHVETDIAIIPVGLHPVVDVKPFVYTFIGGVEREETTRDGSMVLEPLYQSPIHNLRGCVRGLKIGDEVVNLREKITENHLGIRSGCDITCVDCHNGGHCAADWTNPVKQPLVPACDCARTSYEGLSCNIDNGMHIPDDSSFTFRASPILRRIIASRKGRQEIRFAFAVEKSTALLKSRQFPSKRSLANVYFTDTSYFEFVINKNLTLNVGYVDINGQIRVLNFDENFADGYRHFIRMRFGEKNRTIITADTLTSTFTHPAESTIPNLFDVDRIQFAVARETELVPPSQTKQPFKGCISNVALDFYKNPPLILQPISYFFNDTHEYHEFATSSGEVSPGKCSSFQSPDFLTGQKNPVELAEWDTNFARLDYTGPIMQMPEDEGSSLWWIILIVFLILLALLIAFCTYKMLCKKDNESGRPFETEPLHRPKATKNIYSPPPLINDPKSNYQVPEPHVNLDGEHPSDHSSLYDNRDTDNDSDTIRHIDDDDIVIVDRPNGVHNTPHRVSSFRSGDPTVPQGSPLYSPSSPRPTVIPIPPPRLETPIRSST